MLLTPQRSISQVRGCVHVSRKCLLKGWKPSMLAVLWIKHVPTSPASLVKSYMVFSQERSGDVHLARAMFETRNVTPWCWLAKNGIIPYNILTYNSPSTMLVKQCHKPPIWIDGWNPAHRHGWSWGWWTPDRALIVVGYNPQIWWLNTMRIPMVQQIPDGKIM